MQYLLIAASATTLFLATTAFSQSVTTIGGSTAEACYEAARDHRTTQHALDTCDEAFRGVLSAPDMVATHVNRGILQALKQNYSKALRDYDTAIALDPGEAEAFLNKGLLLVHMPDRDQEALDVLGLALIKKTKKPALAYFARALANEGLGHVGAAYQDHRRAAALAPSWELPTRELRRFKTKR